MNKETFHKLIMASGGYTKDRPYKILGIYKPYGKLYREIGKDLTDITKSLGYIPFKNDEIKRNNKAIWSDYHLHAEVRRKAVIGSEGTEWHQDGDTSTKNMNCGMILWADRDGTEFKVEDKVFQCLPYQIVYFNNLDCYHRRPPHVEGKRISFRQRVEIK